MVTVHLELEESFFTAGDRVAPEKRHPEPSSPEPQSERKSGGAAIMQKKSLTKKELSRISLSQLEQRNLNDEEKKIVRALFAETAEATRKSFAALSTQLAEVTKKGLGTSIAQAADAVRRGLDYMKGDNQPGPRSIEQGLVKFFLSGSDQERITAIERVIEHFPSIREIKIYRKSVDNLKKGSLYAALMAVINAPQMDGKKSEDLSFPELQKIPDLKEQIRANYKKAKRGSYQGIKYHEVKRQIRIRKPKTASSVSHKEPENPIMPKEISEMLEEYSEILRETKQTDNIRRKPLDEIALEFEDLLPETEVRTIPFEEWDPHSTNFPNRKNLTEDDILFVYNVNHNLTKQLKSDGLTAGERKAAIDHLVYRKVFQSAAEKQAWKRAKKKLSKYL